MFDDKVLLITERVKQRFDNLSPAAQRKYQESLRKSQSYSNS